jgi:hypothetical protein
MFKKVTKLLGAIALTGWMGVANASLIFDFSWDSSNGKISGEILGLVDNNASQSASAIILTGIDGVSVQIDFLDTNTFNVITNSFSVSGGVVDFVDVFAMDPNGSFFSIWSFSGGNYVTAAPSNRQYIASPGSGIKFVNRVTVPEPDSVILVLLGLAGLSFARYRRQS